MNTTSLLVDILIIGIEVLIWLSLLIFTFIIKIDSFRFENTPIIVFAIIAISYVLGVTFDYPIATVFEWFKGKKEKELYKNVSVIRILNKESEIQKYLDSQYARLRIARATLFNLPLITASVCCFICFGHPPIHFYENEIPMVIGIGTALTILAYWSWLKRNQNYQKFIKDTLVVLNLIS